jgi:hypothetical protein
MVDLLKYIVDLLRLSIALFAFISSSFPSACPVPADIWFWFRRFYTEIKKIKVEIGFSFWKHVFPRHIFAHAYIPTIYKEYTCACIIQNSVYETGRQKIFDVIVTPILPNHHW